MESGLKMLSDAMVTKLHMTDVIANNIANSNTTGFKQMDIATHTTFSDEISKLQKADIPRKETALNSAIPKISGSFIDPTAGAIKITENQYDFALKEPDMMFMIQLGDDQIAYTRDGSFKSLDNMLVTGDGKAVLGVGGGVVELEDGEIPQLGVVSVDFKTLEPKGDNTYVIKENNNIPAEIEDASVYIMQGALETSNVNIVKSMTELIVAHREFEQMSKLIQGIDDINSQSASEVGNVRA